MKKKFNVGDHVSWNSEVGRVRGTIIRKLIRKIKFKGYFRHASRENPYYLIRCAKTDHIAVHQGAALRKLTANQNKHSA